MRNPKRTAPRKVATEFLSAEVSRRQQILDEATRFFAEFGFSGSTTELAKRLGVTQPLLYKYFESKEKLIRLCLENAYPVEKHHERWLALLTRRDRPVRDRLYDFYCDYSDLIFSRDFLRLALWSELTPYHIGPKFKNVVVTSLFSAILNEIRHENGLSATATPTDTDLEIVYSLHGSVHHLNVRRWIGRWKDLADDIHPQIGLKVDLFLAGAIALTRANNPVNKTPRRRAPSLE